MVAQAMPARANIAFISMEGLLSRRKAATPKAAASMMTPARMVFFPAHLRGDHSHGQVGDNSRRLGDDQGEIIVLMENITGVNRVFTGNGVIAEKTTERWTEG